MWRVIVFIFTIMFAIALCLTDTSEDEARDALTAAGYTDAIVAPGYDGVSYFSCGHGDANGGRKFTSKNSDGHPISGVVCCGILFKSCTVRF